MERCFSPRLLMSNAAELVGYPRASVCVVKL